MVCLGGDVRDQIQNSRKARARPTEIRIRRLAKFASQRQRSRQFATAAESRSRQH